MVKLFVLYASVYVKSLFWVHGGGMAVGVYLICMSTQLLSKYQNIPVHSVDIAIILLPNSSLLFLSEWCHILATSCINQQTRSINLKIKRQFSTVCRRGSRLHSQLIYNVYINSNVLYPLQSYAVNNKSSIFRYFRVGADWRCVESRSIGISLLLLWHDYYIERHFHFGVGSANYACDAKPTIYSLAHTYIAGIIII